MEGQESRSLRRSRCFHRTLLPSIPFTARTQSANPLESDVQPTCHVSHLPGYITKYSEFKSKGVDVVACLAYNDAWVMSAWGRVSGGKDDVSSAFPFVSVPGGRTENEDLLLMRY